MDFTRCAPILLEEGFVAKLFNNIAHFVKSAGTYVVLIIGISLIIMTVMQIARGFVSRGGTNWLVVIGGLLIGGILTVGGWKMLSDNAVLGSIGQGTYEKLIKGIEPSAIGDKGFSGDSGSAEGGGGSEGEGEGEGSGGGSGTLGYLTAGLKAIGGGFIVPFGEALALCTGVGLVVAACWQVAKFFMAAGRTNIQWLRTLAMFIVGTCLFVATPGGDDEAGWKWVRDFAVSGSKDAVENLANGENVDKEADGIGAESFKPKSKSSSSDP